MTLIKPPLAPMEARSVDAIPTGDGWQYEPKFDGFRCLAFRREKEVYLQSKSGQPLARYFPDIAAALLQLPAKRFVLDGELVIDVGGRFSFDELQLRLHPAASRVQKLAAAHPATFIVFDLLESETGKSLLQGSAAGTSDCVGEIRRQEFEISSRDQTFTCDNVAGSSEKMVRESWWQP